MRNLGGRSVCPDPESETGPDSEVPDIDFLHPHLLQLRPVEKPQAVSEKHRHDVNVELVDELSLKQLADNADSTHNLNCFIAGGGPGLLNRLPDSLGHERER